MPPDASTARGWLQAVVAWARGRAAARRIREQDVEAAARAGEARFQAVFENAGFGISVTDRDGFFLEVNPGWAAFLGYAEEELLRLRHDDVTHPEDVDASRANAERLFMGEIGAYTQEKRYLRKGGRVVWGLALRSDAPFDLVLMDIQMPEVDGLQAASRIREVRPQLAIVAMTAHAMGSERQRCLDVGMRDHIAKPFEAEELWRVIEPWLPPSPPPAAPGGEVPGPGEDRFLAALRHDIETCLARLRLSITTGDAELARDAAHALKGLSLPPAWAPLRDLARALERAARDSEPWLAWAETLERSATEMLHRAPAPAPRPAPAVPVAPALVAAPAGAELRPVLEGLAAALRRKSLGAKDQVDELRLQLGPDPRVLRIEEALDRVQFGEAEAGLRALAAELGLPLAG